MKTARPLTFNDHTEAITFGETSHLLNSLTSFGTTDPICAV